MLVPFFQAQDVVLVMVVGIEVGDVELAIVQYYQDALVVIKFAEVSTVLIIIDAVDIWIEPNLSASQGAVAMALQADATDRTLGEQIAFGGTSLDQNVGEVFLQEDALALLGQVWLQGYLDELCLAIRVGGEVNDTAARCALGDVVYLVTGHGGYVESLDEVIALLSVSVKAGVDGALVVLLL